MLFTPPIRLTYSPHLFTHHHIITACCCVMLRAVACCSVLLLAAAKLIAVCVSPREADKLIFTRRYWIYCEVFAIWSNCSPKHARHVWRSLARWGTLGWTNFTFFDSIQNLSYRSGVKLHFTLASLIVSFTPRCTWCAWFAERIYRTVYTKKKIWRYVVMLKLLRVKNMRHGSWHVAISTQYLHGVIVYSERIIANYLIMLCCLRSLLVVRILQNLPVAVMVLQNLPVAVMVCFHASLAKIFFSS